MSAHFLFRHTSIYLFPWVKREEPRKTVLNIRPTTLGEVGEGDLLEIEKWECTTRMGHNYFDEWIDCEQFVFEETFSK